MEELKDRNSYIKASNADGLAILEATAVLPSPAPPTHIALDLTHPADMVLSMQSHRSLRRQDDETISRGAVLQVRHRFSRRYQPGTWC